MKVNLPLSDLHDDDDDDDSTQAHTWPRRRSSRGMWSANCIWPNDDCAPMRILLSRAVFNFHIAVFFVCVLHMFNDQLDRAGQRTGGECIEEEEDPSWVTRRIGEGRGPVGRRLLYIGVGCVILDIHIYISRMHWGNCIKDTNTVTASSSSQLAPNS